ncbi:DNA binding domain, excisionase family [[Clostridium] cf. saccharolyticum K10]|nr:DNA binding domain, excisionase family [[Clostridium] cf. saccharolyticum K10]
MTFPVMLTLRQAAKETGLSYSYLRKLCLEGKIVFVKSGRKYLVNAERLKEYLNEGEGV